MPTLARRRDYVHNVREPEGLKLGAWYPKATIAWASPRSFFRDSNCMNITRHERTKKEGGAIYNLADRTNFRT